MFQNPGRGKEQILGQFQIKGGRRKHSISGLQIRETLYFEVIVLQSKSDSLLVSVSGIIL